MMKGLEIVFKINFLFIVSIFVFIGCSNDDSQDSSDEPPIDPSSWNLIFEDEFNDLSSWNVWQGGAFNNEIQLYREAQLSINNSILEISAKRESASGPTSPFDATPKTFEYVSGRIETKQTFGPSDKDGEREYRFMAKIKLPYGHGMWPAFWSYGDPWPTQGEIDILEARGSETNMFQSNIFYGPSPNVNINTDTEAIHTTEQDLTEGFHIYEMIWRAGAVDILFDDELIYTYTANSHNNISNLLGKKQKVVLNTAVGGWFFSDQDSSNYADSSTMEIDWVKVYKR